MFWIADTILVCIAWKRGWGKLSFLPILIGLMAAGLLTLICGFSGKSSDMILMCMLMIEVAVSCSMLGLCVLGAEQNTSTG